MLACTACQALQRVGRHAPGHELARDAAKADDEHRLAEQRAPERHAQAALRKGLSHGALGAQAGQHQIHRHLRAA
jgi:hypothetical protein